ncbi:hypothetical protein [Chitinophaga nivalis]|uniref:Bacteriocin n=1 Tax=Chitinophaga nivalis TaxID=2991709 RepID=A0ABT3IM83_9BACT|nr:hypothetical protein [Chitinophaga nivalis]MCW3465226.1 hypothetical protein [Chitinophaga nivalis]MCW3485082.1 hypothetical protein [Chitinophaga nivalis]
MKKKQTKKLNLGKIKIADLNASEKTTLNGGLLPLPPTGLPTKLTRCFICPVSDIC